MRPYYPKMNIAFFMQGTVKIRLAVIDNFATTRDMFILTYPASFPYWIFSSPGNSFKIQAKYFQPECSIGIWLFSGIERQNVNHTRILDLYQQKKQWFQLVELTLILCTDAPLSHFAFVHGWVFAHICKGLTGIRLRDRLEVCLSPILNFQQYFFHKYNAKLIPRIDEATL